MTSTSLLYIMHNVQLLMYQGGGVGTLKILCVPRELQEERRSGIWRCHFERSVSPLLEALNSFLACRLQPLSTRKGSLRSRLQDNNIRSILPDTSDFHTARPLESVHKLFDKCWFPSASSLFEMYLH